MIHANQIMPSPNIQNMKAVLQSVGLERKDTTEEIEHLGEWDHGMEPDVLHAGYDARRSSKGDDDHDHDEHHEPREAIDRLADESIRRKVEKFIHKIDVMIEREGSSHHMNEHEEGPIVAYGIDRTS